MNGHDTAVSVASGDRALAHSPVLAFIQAATVLWLRDMLRMMREPSRWLGVVAQPVLFWVILATGMADVFAAGSASARTYFFPGIVVMAVLFTVIFGTITIIEDRQGGFLQAVLVAPAHRSAVLAGKVAGVTTLALIEAALVLLLAPLAGFSVAHFQWGVLALALFSVSASLAAVNFAMAWALNSTQGYHAVMSAVLLPAWFISGALFPASGGWLGTVMRFNPMAYAVDVIGAAMTGRRGQVFGASAVVSLAVLAGLLVLGVVLSLLALERGEEVGA